ncbi:MAG: hypothetical protein QF437_20405 [Planctomycetota bacterium]|jgi:hypothetical protein|nr:hypothetical protein [Planctomycetota bacterium]MDP7132869.1 hypothetical protein [Planctomycetota bacterium]
MLFILFLAANVDAHPLDDPVMSLKVEITEEAVLYRVSVPTFIFEPLKGITYKSGLDETELKWDEVESYFKRRNPVHIDGIRVLPVLGDLKFVQVDNFEPGAAPSEHEGKILQYARAEISLRHGTKSKPGEVRMKWETFIPPELQETIVTLSAFGRRQLILFNQNDNEQTWRATTRRPSVENISRVRFMPTKVNLWLAWAYGLLILIAGIAFRRSPVVIIIVSLALLIGLSYTLPKRGQVSTDIVLPSPSNSAALFSALLSNIYRSFDYTDEDDIYDTLAQSVDGPMLDKIYNQVYQSLLQREEGGAVSMVQRVEIVESKVDQKEPMADASSARLSIHCRWRVHGAVEHWGHSHRRLNEYQASYVLMPRDGRWKITAVEVKEQKRIEIPKPAA